MLVNKCEADKSRSRKSRHTNAKVKRLFMILGFCQLAFEFHSIRLLLWPVNHSCARPKWLSGFSDLFKDSKGKQIDLETIQENWFDATSEDLFSVTRAAMMGINVDDISHCFMYPVEQDIKTGNVTVNREGLEPCRYGLHFEELEGSLSVVSHFELVCSRQWLRVLLAQSFGLGILIGFLLSYGLFFRLRPAHTDIQRHSLSLDTPNSSSIARNERESTSPSKADLLIWSAFQISINLFVHLCAWQLDRDRRHPVTSFNNVIQDSRTNHVGYTTETSKPPTYDTVMIMMNQHTDFVLLIASILFRSVLISSNLAKIIWTWKLNPKSPRFPHVGSSHEIHSNEDLDYFVSLSTVFLVFQALFLPIAWRIFSSWSQLCLWLSHTSCCYGALVILSELVEPQRWMLTQEPEDESELAIRLQTDNLFGVAGKGRGLDEGACKYCLLERKDSCSIADQNRVVWPSLDRIYQPTSLPLDLFDRSHLSRIRKIHDMNEAQISLSRWSIAIQLSLMSFMTAFNYNLLRSLPDHKFMRPESIASMTRRKLLNPNYFSDAETLISTYTYQFQGQDSTLDSSTRSSINIHSINHATRMMDIMQHSSNLPHVLLVSMLTTGWPIELAVVLLHLDRLKWFRSTCFKLGRFLILVKLSAAFLSFQWISIGS